MSECKTIITFASGRTVELNGDWVDVLSKRNTITQFQFFASEEGKGPDNAINMDQVETVKVVDGDG